MIPKRSELIDRYGEIENGFWPGEQLYMVMLPVPREFADWLRYDGKPVHSIYCNRDMAVALKLTLDDIADKGLCHLLVEFNGCFSIRKSRGLESLSVHSYGLAVDFNASTNRMGSVPKMDPRIVKSFKDHGFVWGGDWSRLDGMHFQYCTED